MIAVADTSPISALLRIGRLTLLTALFESVLIPREVAGAAGAVSMAPGWPRRLQ
jgi:predicted nucleic acid-binding protein